MMVTSAKRRSIFIFATVSSAGIFSLEKILSKALEGWERERKGDGGLSSTFSPLLLPLSLSAVILSLPPASLPPLYLNNVETLMWFGSTWLTATFPFPFFFFYNDATVDVLLTRRHRRRSRQLIGATETSDTSSLPYLGKTPLWVGIAVAHLKVGAW